MMRRQGGVGRPFQPSKAAAAYRTKAERRARSRRQREEFQANRIVRMWVRAIGVSEEQKEWRIALLTGPDDRSLTGILMGDPRYLRSSLYFKRMGAA